jgi:hypothetical protein
MKCFRASSRIRSLSRSANGEFSMKLQRRNSSRSVSVPCTHLPYFLRRRAPLQPPLQRQSQVFSEAARSPWKSRFSREVHDRKQLFDRLHKTRSRCFVRIRWVRACRPAIYGLSRVVLKIFMRKDNVYIPLRLGCDSGPSHYIGMYFFHGVFPTKSNSTARIAPFLRGNCISN